MSKSGKGSGFEREVCKKLSLWLTGGRTDEGLWRTSQSGGRATMRRRGGKRAETHAGDIAGTTPEGEALCRHLCFELKTGYGRWSAQDTLDATQKGRCVFAKFVEQAVEQCPPRKFPVLITRRLGGRAVLWLPGRLARAVDALHRIRYVRICNDTDGCWHGVLLDDLLQETRPQALIDAAQTTAPTV